MAETELVILDIEHIDDWQNALNSVAMRDVYFVPLYLQMVSKNGDGIPKLAWLRRSHANVIYPFLVRPMLMANLKWT